MLRALPAILVLAVLSLAFAVPAQAVLITVNFTVTGGATGSFSFDNGLIPVGGGTVGSPANTSVDYSSSISFTYNGDVFTETNSGVNFLRFDASGTLTQWMVGGDVSGLGTLSSNVGPDWNVAAVPGSTGFLYTHGTTESFVLGSVTSWSTTTGAAPEPASWMLLGGALVGLVGVRRRARK